MRSRTPPYGPPDAVAITRGVLPPAERPSMLSGVFPERIRFRAEARGFPNVKYYDALGRAQYRAASDHRLAQRYELAEIFHTLAERFETTRRALNDIAKKLNLGVSIARGEMLLLLNDDIELIVPDWIERMLQHFEKRHVGIENLPE